MPGFVHIFHLGAREGTYGRMIPEYQFNYTLGGNTFARTFDEDGLEEFLRRNMGLPVEAAQRAMDELRRSGKTTIAGVDIPEHEAAALGLEQVPSDY